MTIVPGDPPPDFDPDDPRWVGFYDPEGTARVGLKDEIDLGDGFGWYSSAELSDDGTIVAVTFQTPFGIDANTGIPYFDPGNVTPGEEAVLLPDLTLMQPGK